jgi:hypothetical protein
MGYRFIETTVPALVEELRRLNDHLDKLAPVLKAMAESKDKTAAPGNEEAK